jgi:hypothetical protein
MLQDAGLRLQRLRRLVEGPVLGEVSACILCVAAVLV